MDQATVKKEEKTLPAPEKSANEKKFVSKGWKVHNEITYRGVDWLLNSTIGVISTYWTDRLTSGKKVAAHIDKYVGMALKPAFKTEAGLVQGTTWFRRFLTIMVGGFTIIPVMMYMENKQRKKKMVHWLDEKMYGKDVVANDPKFEESYKKIEEEPKQGFWIGVVSRIIAITPIIAAATWPASNQRLIKYIYDPIARGTKWVSKKVGIKPGKMLMQGELEHLDGNPKGKKQWQSNWDFFHRTIGFDFGLTIFYAMLHEAAYKSLAAMGMKKTKEDKKQKTAPAETAAAPAESPPAALAAEETGKFVASVGQRKAMAEPAAAYTDKVAAETQSLPQAAI